jgi:hypothetical protein
MTLRLKGAACAVAIAAVACGSAIAAPAAAPVPQATVSADYSYLDTNVSHNINEFGGAISAVAPIGDGDFSVQGDGAYHYLTTSGVSLNDYAVGGSLTWRDGGMGRVGATVAYSGFQSNNSGAHVNLNFVSYGAYGEWFASDAFTLGAKAGGASVSGGGGGIGFGNATLGYAGAELVGYATPDVAISGTVDYLGGSGGNLTTAGAKVEWLVSRTTPISVYVGYNYDDLSGVTANIFTVGAKWYIGGGATSLVDHQRNGVDDWGTLPSARNVSF